MAIFSEVTQNRCIKDRYPPLNKNCQEFFDFSLPSVLWAKRIAKSEVSFECFVCVIIVWFRLYCLLFVVYHVCLANKDSRKLTTFRPVQYCAAISACWAVVILPTGLGTYILTSLLFYKMSVLQLPRSAQTRAVRR